MPKGSTACASGDSSLPEIVLSFVKRSLKVIRNVTVELFLSLPSSILEIVTTKEICKCPFCTSEKRKCVRSMGTERKTMEKSL